MWRRNLASLQCEAAHLPLPDESVDLIVTSPPYFQLRDYQDSGQSVAGQVGNEPTSQEFLESLWTCTREWMRVLKPRGSIFVNLGDKYAGGGGRYEPAGAMANPNPGTISNGGQSWGFRSKSLMNLPARYAIGCTDQLGLIQRAEIVWSKPNGMPEPVKDRVRRSHELVFHFTKQGDYYQAVDRIREPHKGDGKGKTTADRRALGEPMRYGDTPGGASGAMVGGLAGHVLGKLPSSVWEIPTAPLVVPKWLQDEMESLWYELEESEKFDVDHFAAFPPALVQKIIDGWSPAHVCTKCGQGRFPVSSTEYEKRQRTDNAGKLPAGRTGGDLEHGRLRPQEVPFGRANARVTVIGSACACTPYEDHPERRGKDWRGGVEQDRRVSGQRMGKDFQGNGHPSRSGGEWRNDQGMARNEWGRGPVRDYLFDQWEPAPTVPGVVLDPFGGTGTTAIVAAIMGRRGISGDLSFDYAGRMVPWRANDRSQMKSLLGRKS